MVQQLLIPGMEHGEKSELGAQMAGIGGNGEQRFRNGLEQDVVDEFADSEAPGPAVLREA